MGGGSFGKSVKGYVLSRSLPAGERDGLIFTSQTPAALIAEIRQRKGKNTSALCRCFSATVFRSSPAVSHNGTFVSSKTRATPKV
jgi:hypothetical protein